MGHPHRAWKLSVVHMHTYLGVRVTEISSTSFLFDLRDSMCAYFGKNVYYKKNASIFAVDVLL